MAHAQLRRFVRQVIAEARNPKPNPTEVAIAAVVRYTENPKITNYASAHEDPRRPGVVAVRATMHGSDMDFLVYNCDGEPDVGRDVEEVEFTTWPPTSGGRGTGSRMQVRGMF